MRYWFWSKVCTISDVLSRKTSITFINFEYIYLYSWNKADIAIGEPPTYILD